MAPINILSIDFDYFIHFASRESALFCPDSGIEYQDDLAQLCWMTKYATALSAGVNMETILSLRDADLDFVKSIIKQQEDPYCMVCDSHANILNFALRIFQGEPITIYNVDAHHDSYPRRHEEKEIAPCDCGNWATTLLDMKVVESIYWISPEDEPHSPAGNDCMDPRIKTNLRLCDLSNVSSFDGIFLCRSGSWTPPHLDRGFLTLAQLLVQPDGGWECRLQKGIMDSRYNDDFIHGAQELKAYYPPQRVRTSQARRKN